MYSNRTRLLVSLKSSFQHTRQRLKAELNHMDTPLLIASVASTLQMCTSLVLSPSFTSSRRLCHPVMVYSCSHGPLEGFTQYKESKPCAVRTLLQCPKSDLQPFVHACLTTLSCGSDRLRAISRSSERKCSRNAPCLPIYAIFVLPSRVVLLFIQ